MKAEAKEVDVAIIGAGTAAITARRAIKAAGASLVMIDSGPFGTTCARVGCMPSKLLLAAADVAHRLNVAPTFGVHPQEIRIDGRQVLQRVRSERDRFVGSALGVIDEAKAAGEVLVGRARVAAPGRLTLDSGPEVRFKQLVIAAGTRPLIPKTFQHVKEVLLTNEEIFELETLPESLLVIGLGVIGLELGQAFHRLGVRTTLLGVGGAIGPFADPELLTEARRLFQGELDLHPGHQLQTVERVGLGVRLRFVDAHGRARDETFERVLMAAGRGSNLHGMGLDTLGVRPDDHGRYHIDPGTLQLADAPVFVAGDANELHPVLHEAADDGRIAGENAARFPELRALQRRTPLSIVFSDPQIGIVGGGYRALQDCDAAVGQASFEEQGRARVNGTHRGLIRIYAERRRGCLLGAELLGPQMEHLAHLLAWSVQQMLTVDEALQMPFYHPVIEEGLRTALRDLNANLRHGAPIKCRVTELGVGS